MLEDYPHKRKADELYIGDLDIVERPKVFVFDELFLVFFGNKEWKQD